MATSDRHTGVRAACQLAGLRALTLIGRPVWAQQPLSDAAQPLSATLPPVNIIGTSPLLGSGVDRDTVPAATNVLRRDDLARGGTTTPDAVRALNEQVGGCEPRSASGNPYQPTLFYHGFQASALQGHRRVWLCMSTVSASIRALATRSISTCCPAWQSIS